MTASITSSCHCPTTKRRLAHAARSAPVMRAARSLPDAVLRTPARCACGGYCPRCRPPVSSTLPSLQRKPVVSTPGDALEREADEVADRVMRMTEPAPAGHALGTRPSAGTDRQAIYRRGTPATPIDTWSDADARIAAVRTGEPLAASERAFFEPRFGLDFSRVRVHRDATADAAARSVGALAYARGGDIVFRSGAYAPGTTAGRHLLAHELAHVVQQGAGALAPQVRRRLDEDGEDMGEEPAPAPPRRLPELTQEEAEQRGREALATVGYEELIRRAVGAGILAPPGAVPGQQQVQRAIAPGTLARQDFSTVFTPYAVAAGISSQLDSPAPGPGDVIALGILAVGLIVALTTATSTTRAACPPCPRPPNPDVDRVPPSRRHGGCPGDHWHYYEYNQDPVSCICYGPRRRFGGCCVGAPGAPC